MIPADPCFSTCAKSSGISSALQLATTGCCFQQCRVLLTLSELSPTCRSICICSRVNVQHHIVKEYMLAHSPEARATSQPACFLIDSGGQLKATLPCSAPLTSSSTLYSCPFVRPPVVAPPAILVLYLAWRCSLRLLLVCTCPPLCAGALWPMPAWVWRDIRPFSFGLNSHAHLMFNLGLQNLLFLHDLCPYGTCMPMPYKCDPGCLELSRS